ncbi:HAD-IIA family hydrolase, partial [Actinomyces polynesiensis]|uniref:HAD-IIA family hydrolase n=1 Tax=Actinomyces polynesiensis TaxID=1325934 RepID=UPI00093A4145
RDDRGGDRRSYQSRDDRGGERRSYQSRDDRGGERRSYQSRDDRGGERRGGYRKDDRNRQSDHAGRGGRGREDRNERYSSTDEYVSPNPEEPAIPAGVSADELDADVLRALNTLSGPNRDIVARHLVMSGQLLDLDPEQAYQHAHAAAERAGRVDVVREAAALTAYASGRYEEALREVRAVRRMRGDDSLRAIEADSERGLGRPEKAVEIIDSVDTRGMDLADQVELVLVSSGARADLGQNEVGLVLVDDALAALPEDADPELFRRLMSVKADRLRELGRDDEADEVEAAMPAEVDDPEIVDVELFADADVDRKPSPLRGTETTLCTTFDGILMDLDGVAYHGTEPVDHAAESVVAARAAGMKTAFLTNNASRSPSSVAERLSAMGFGAEPGMVMTSAMDVVAYMDENLEPGTRVLVVGGQGLRDAVTEGGYQIVESADDEPGAVVQGFDPGVGWAELSEAVYAIQRGATFFATNLDATLPTERGFAIGNGSLVRAVQNATGRRPIAAGKPEPGIYSRAAALVGATNPVAVGDRLETDVAGAVAAGLPSMHVLTGVHQARDVIMARRGQRPAFLARDLRGLVEEHPRPKHHRDGSWTCGFSQVARVLRDGTPSLDDVELATATTVTLDSYRALAAAAWDAADEGTGVVCPEITVVDNDDPSGVVSAPEPEPEPAVAPVAEPAGTDEQDPQSADGDAFSEEDLELGVVAEDLADPAGTPTFLPGEEELQALLEGTGDASPAREDAHRGAEDADGSPAATATDVDGDTPAVPEGDEGGSDQL